MSNRVRHFRKQTKLTQIDLSNLVGITQASISAIERGGGAADTSMKAIYFVLREHGATCTFGQLWGVEPVESDNGQRRAPAAFVAA